MREKTAANVKAIITCLEKNGRACVASIDEVGGTLTFSVNFYGDCNRNGGWRRKAENCGCNKCIGKI